MRRGVVALVATVAIAAGAVVWLNWPAGDESAIRSRLDAFCTDVNTTTPEGIGTVAHAATLGDYFTESAEVELGRGSAAITGRETIVGMAARLQPRTSAFRLKFDDVEVRMGPARTTADVTLTASFIRRSTSSGDESMDAIEFRLALAREGSTWRIARVTAVQTLK